MDRSKYKNILTADAFVEKYKLVVSPINTYTLEEFNEWLSDGDYDVIDFSRFNFDRHAGLFSDTRLGVSFEKVVFPSCGVSFEYATFGVGPVNFSNTIFEGNVSFIGTDFGDGDIDFRGSHFFGRHVSFADTVFGVGEIDFNESYFYCENVRFTNASFGDGHFDFSLATFEGGRVDFGGAVFGVGDVLISCTNFGGGSINFINTLFGKGIVNFSDSMFGKGIVDFSNANFEEGGVYFVDVDFGEGDVCFIGTNFGDGDVNFGNANFGPGTVQFIGASFGVGNIIFSYVSFGRGSADFSNAVFGEGDVDFNFATFDGGVNFSRATFGEGIINLTPKYFACGGLNLSGVKCNGFLQIDGISGLCGSIILSSSVFYNGFKLSKQLDEQLYRNHQKPKSLLKFISFNSARFDNGMILEGVYDCPVDMRNTDIRGHFSMDNVDIHLQRVGPFYKRIAVSEQSAGWFRRLKDLADQARNKELSLKFHASELRALRWHHRGPLASILDMIYSSICDYGRSVSRPLSALGFLTLLCALYYSDWSFEKIKPAADLSIANAFPYLSKKQAEESLQALCNGLSDSFVYTLVRMGQGIGTSILLFLAGLGLRNRFRL